jgi:hypothetical protein
LNDVVLKLKEHINSIPERFTGLGDGVIIEKPNPEKWNTTSTRSLAQKVNGIS